MGSVTVKAPEEAPIPKSLEQPPGMELVQQQLRCWLRMSKKPIYLLRTAKAELAIALHRILC